MSKKEKRTFSSYIIDVLNEYFPYDSTSTSNNSKIKPVNSTKPIKIDILNTSKSKFDKVNMKTAILWSKESYCKRNQVGAVISLMDRSIIPAYNGTISGVENNCEKKCDVCNGSGTVVSEVLECSTVRKQCFRCGGQGIITNDFTLHAEANAITHAANEGISLNGTTIYVTTSPCKECSKLIAQSGIARVVYLNEYKDTSGLDFLKSIGNISVEKYISKD